MNKFFWEFNNTFELPQPDDLFPHQYYNIRRRYVPNEVLPQEFHDKLTSVGLYVTRVRANYAPAGVDRTNKKYGFIATKAGLQPNCRIDFVIKGAETSKLVWWNDIGDDYWCNNPGKDTEASFRPNDESIMTKQFEYSYKTALVNTQGWTSVETTTEDRFWLKVYFRTIGKHEQLAFYDARELLQRVL